MDHLASAETPAITAWRDLTDAMNFLQSMAELGWMSDPDGIVNETKGALVN
jgi:hypothetical protein